MMNQKTFLLELQSKPSVSDFYSEHELKRLDLESNFKCAMERRTRKIRVLEPFMLILLDLKARYKADELSLEVLNEVEAALNKIKTDVYESVSRSLQNYYQLDASAAPAAPSAPAAAPASQLQHAHTSAFEPICAPQPDAATLSSRLKKPAELFKLDALKDSFSSFNAALFSKNRKAPAAADAARKQSISRFI